MVRVDEIAAFKLSDRCMQVVQHLFLLGIPLTIANVYFATQYAWIWANQWSYGSEDWQRCLLFPNKASDALADVKTQFPVSVSSYAGRIFVFIIVSFKMTYTGINDTDLLPYAIFVTFISCLGVLIYRESSPIQPQPSSISSTLLTLMKFITPDMYDDLNEAHANASGARPVNCEPAQEFNHWFLMTAYATFGLLLCNHILVIVNTCLNYRYGVRWSIPLDGVWPTLVLAFCALGGYITCFVAKEIAAQEAIDLMRSNVFSIHVYPFRKGEMDIVSLTLMATFGAIGMGICKGDLEKFKLAAFIAYLNTAISYPSVMGTLNAYQRIMYPSIFNGGKSYDLWNVEECIAYTYEANPTYKMLYTPDDVMAPICRTLPISLIGQLIQFGCTHLLVISCIYVVYKNKYNDSINEAKNPRKSCVLPDDLKFSVHAFTSMDNNNDDKKEALLARRGSNMRRVSNIGGRSSMYSGPMYRNRPRQSMSYFATDNVEKKTNIDQINADYNSMYNNDVQQGENEPSINVKVNSVRTSTTKLFGVVSDTENPSAINTENPINSTVSN